MKRAGKKIYGDIMRLTKRWTCGKTGRWTVLHADGPRGISVLVKPHVLNSSFDFALRKNVGGCELEDRYVSCSLPNIPSTYV